MTLLNEADTIYVGGTPADRVYLGSNLVWEPSAGAAWGPDERMYPLDATPASASSSGSVFMLGNRLTVLADGRITGVWFWGTATVVSRYCALWSDTGTLLAGGTFTGEANGFNKLLFATPVAVTAGQIVRTAYGYAGAVASGNFYFSLDTPPNAGPNLRWEAGVYSDIGAGNTAFPNNTITPNHYFGDVVFQEKLEVTEPGEPWTPHEIEDAMYGWWDASIPSSLTWSGINLLEIADQGPGNLHMGRAAGSGPTAATLNGLGALAFTYDQGLMTPSATTFNDFTIHAVFNPGFSDGSTYERIVDHSYAAGWWFGRTGSTATFGGGVMEGPEVGYGIFVPLANNEVHQISNVREGAVHRISGNGGAVTNSRAIHTSPTASNRVYMAQDNLGTSDVTDGEIGEVIIWKRALSADEMAKTEGYLAWKWGIQAKLPAGHPYKGAAP